MRVGGRSNSVARRIWIAALFVVAPVWLSACGAAKEADSRAAQASATASIAAATASSESATAAPSARATGLSVGPAQTDTPDEAAAASTPAQRTVTFKLARGGTVKLPLVGVQTEYGVDEGHEPPSLLPAAGIPDQAFTVPADQGSKLALYWMNLGYDDRGFMMLAPKGWTVKGIVGADGSFAMHAEDPKDAGRFLDTIDTAGGCQGCAIADIGASFPELAKWAEEQGFPAQEPKVYLSSKPVGDRMIEFTEVSGAEHGGYGVLGAAYEEHEGGSLFRSARTGYADADQAVADTMIAFYEWMYKGN